MIEGCNNEVNMEGSSFQLLNESPVSEDMATMRSSLDTEESTCRLRNTLNEDCILNVFEFLNVTDLIQMSKVHIYFKNLITKWIIGKKVLNLRGMDQSFKQEIFQTFGKSMRKFIIYETDFNHLLETIIKYCEPARLTEVEINLKQTNLDVNMNNIQLSMNFMSNLYKLTLNSMSYERINSYDYFLAGIVVAALNLQILHLNHIDIGGAWMKTNRIWNLSELQLHKPRNLNFTDLNTFLACLPNLKSFLFIGKQDITDVGNTLTRCCPNLKTFQDIHVSNPYRHFALGAMNRYLFIAKFSNLKCVTLTSYSFCGSDLYYPLVKLSKTNIVKIKVHSDLEHAVDFDGLERERIMQSSFSHFISLKEVELSVRNFRLNGDLRCDFILYFARQLKNLLTFTLESDRITNANKIIELLPSCRTFSISKIIVKHLPVEMRKIVRTVRTIRQMSDFENDENLLKLIVNVEQWRELQVYKDIKSLMTLVIDHNVEPYNHGRRYPYN